MGWDLPVTLESMEICKMATNTVTISVTLRLGHQAMGINQLSVPLIFPIIFTFFGFPFSLDLLYSITTKYFCVFGEYKHKKYFSVSFPNIFFFYLCWFFFLVVSFCFPVIISWSAFPEISCIYLSFKWLHIFVELWNFSFALISHSGLGLWDHSHQFWFWCILHWWVNNVIFIPPLVTSILFVGQGMVWWRWMVLSTRRRTFPHTCLMS